MEITVEAATINSRLLTLLITFLLSANSYALTLSKMRSLNEGTSVQTLTTDAKSLTLKKESNLFDKKLEPRLGVFTTDDKGKDISEAITSAVKQNPGDFTKDLSKLGHADLFKVDDKFVTPGSPLHLSLQKTFERLQTLHWTHQSGVELIFRKGKLIPIENGKQMKAQVFIPQMSCNNPAPPTLCKIKNQGLIYVE